MDARRIVAGHDPTFVRVDLGQTVARDVAECVLDRIALVQLHRLGLDRVAVLRDEHFVARIGLAEMVDTQRHDFQQLERDAVQAFWLAVF